MTGTASSQTIYPKSIYKKYRSPWAFDLALVYEKYVIYEQYTNFKGWGNNGIDTQGNTHLNF